MKNSGPGIRLNSSKGQEAAAATAAAATKFGK